MNSIEVQFSTKTKMKQSLESYCGMYSTISQLPEEWWLKIVNTMTLLKWQNYSTCIRDLPRVFQKIPTMMKTLIEAFDYHSSCLKNRIFFANFTFLWQNKMPHTCIIFHCNFGHSACFAIQNFGQKFIQWELKIQMNSIGMQFSTKIK